MHSIRVSKRVGLIYCAFIGLASAIVALPSTAQSEREKILPPIISGGEYSHSIWLNGWRKHKAEKSPELLAIQTSSYDFTINLTEFGKAGFRRNVNPAQSYLESLSSDSGELEKLPHAELAIEVVIAGVTYRAVSCTAGTDPDVTRLGEAKMWEAGRFVQHFEFTGLTFEDATGKKLPCVGSLSLVAWPDSLTLTTSLAPDPDSAAEWKDVMVKMRLSGESIDSKNEEMFEGKWSADTTNQITLNHQVIPQPETPDDVKIEVTYGTDQSFPVSFDEKKNCLVAFVPKVKRTFKGGATDIRDYDEFIINIDNPTNIPRRIPFLLDFRDTANITGLCPILCDAEGRPTGIPVQISKNWHYPPMGVYLMAYSTIPAAPGRTQYILRIPYGFYGTLPSASHAQLSLIGWSGKGGNGRWDQLAIGCWGETFCMDMDLSLVDHAITDVRMLMSRDGKDGRMWGWTTAGWGGDWLGMRNAANEKHYFRELKTAYLTHGPCLTESRYEGYYGAAREVGLKAQLKTLRTDDYARTFHNMEYTFHKDGDAKNTYFFKMGPTREIHTPRIAYGNREGLLSEHDVPNDLEPGENFVQHLELTGPGPWWVAYPGKTHTDESRTWGTGSRALIIRSYKAVIGGKEYTNPSITMPVNKVHKGGLDLNLHLVAPEAATRFSPGDTVVMDLEWITLHRTADDYYGPNETYRKQLEEHPSSWQTVYREAIGNDLNVKVRGGTLRNQYPIQVSVEAPVVDVAIQGGVGYVPITFDQCDSYKDYSLYELVDGQEIRLDQSVHGNDFWQVDFDETSQTYKITYNLPLDNKPNSLWRFKSEEQ